MKILIAYVIVVGKKFQFSKKRLGKDGCCVSPACSEDVHTGIRVVTREEFNHQKTWL